MKKRPFIILSGFLGSGKTTLLNKILTKPHGLKIAVIVNEFGEIGLDQSLIRSSHDFVKMDNGCLCCVLNEDLVKTLIKLKNRNDFDAIVLETTGIADPLPVAWTFLRPQMQDSFRFAALVCVVDCLHLNDMLKKADETKLQIERSDVVFLSKTDLASSTQILKAKQKISSINSQSTIFENDLSWMKFLLDDKISLKIDESLLNHHDHQKKFDSFSFDLKKADVSLNDMEDLFENLPSEIFRAKAVFKDKDSNRYIEIHSVCGRVDFGFLEKKPVESAVVFIGKKIDKKKLKKMLEQFLTSPGPS